MLIVKDMITAVYVIVNGHWKIRDKKPEVELGMMDKNRKRFLLTYRKSVVDAGPLQKYQGKMEEKTSPEKLVSEEYYLPAAVGEHI